MDQAQPILSCFFQAIENDPRIGVSHISLYCALLQYGVAQGTFTPMTVVGAEVMKIAKISGLGTYHRCIKDLNSYGYIRYVPSYNHRKKSKVYLLS